MAWLSARLMSMAWATALGGWVLAAAPGLEPAGIEPEGIALPAGDSGGPPRSGGTTQMAGPPQSGGTTTGPLAWADIAAKERLERHVRALAERFTPRDYRHPENLARAADYIEEEFGKAGGRLAVQPYDIDGATYRNVIARFGPEAGPRVVVGAHYDAYKEFPGADDNASGVAGLIEMAHFLGRLGPALESAVELVALSTEEPLFFGRLDKMGSGVHASALVRQAVPVTVAVILDQIGYFSQDEGSQRFPTPALRERAGGTRGDFVLLVGASAWAAVTERLHDAMTRSTNMTVHLLVGPPDEMLAVAPSDLRAYWHYRIPAVLVTDTAPFRGRHRHTADDTPDILSYSAMRAVVRSVAAAVHALTRRPPA